MATFPRPSRPGWRVALIIPALLALFEALASAQELPPEIRMDRYMVQADRQIRNEQYTAALRTLDLIVELREAHDLVLPESFWMKRGEVALGAGDYTEAMASVTRYLEIAGRAGERYTEALELLDQAVEQGCAPERMTETLESVRACLALGADPNGVDDNGRTTLDWAAERNNPAEMPVRTLDRSVLVRPAPVVPARRHLVVRQQPFGQRDEALPAQRHRPQPRARFQQRHDLLLEDPRQRVLA